MRSINKNCINELVIRNSKFITLLFKINDSNINSYLDKVKNDYPKATHYCYAYIVDGVMRSSDDGEPGGTAGVPMLNVLEKESLTNVLAITVRYFGGIKLGAGGLVRAYSKSVKEALDNCEIIELNYGYEVIADISYEDKKDFEYLIRNEVIIDTDYDLRIKYHFYIKKEDLQKLERYSYSIIKELYF